MPTLFIGQKLIYLKKTESTNSFAIQLIENNSEKVMDGMIISAEQQTAGKGQFNRKWISNPGENLTFSLILKPSFLRPEKLFYLNKCICVSITETINAFAMNSCIKWPNDIYVSDKKICGILIENKIKNQQIEFCVAGIGINVNQTVFPEDITATSLKIETGKNIPKDSVLQVFCSKFEKNYLKLKQDIKHFDNVYLQKLKGVNKWQQFRVKNLTASLLIKGVDELGHLITQDQNGNIQKWLSGELQWINEP